VIQSTVSRVELINFYTVEGLYKLIKLLSLSNTILYYNNIKVCIEPFRNNNEYERIRQKRLASVEFSVPTVWHPAVEVRFDFLHCTVCITTCTVET